MGISRPHHVGEEFVPRVATRQRVLRKLYTWIFAANRYQLNYLDSLISNLVSAKKIASPRSRRWLVGGSWIIALRGLPIATPKNALRLVETLVSTAQRNATDVTHKKHTLRYLPRKAIIKG